MAKVLKTVVRFGEMVRAERLVDVQGNLGREAGRACTPRNGSIDSDMRFPSPGT